MHLSRTQLIFISALRMALGWFILFQGINKFYNPRWTSKGYLASSDGPLSGFFVELSKHEGLLEMLDILNIYGQLAIGISLILGLFSSYASVLGVCMLLLYYLAHPPFIGLSSMDTSVLVNELLIMILGMLVVYFIPSSHRIGLDRFIGRD